MHVLPDCREAKHKQLMKRLGAESKPPVTQSCTGNPEHAHVGAKSKALLCAPVHGSTWSISFSLVRLCKGKSNQFWQIYLKRRKTECEPLAKSPLGYNPAALVTLLSTSVAIARALSLHMGKFKASVKQSKQHFSAATWRWRD